VSRFGASLKPKFSGLAVTGSPEDQLRGPLDLLVELDLPGAGVQDVNPEEPYSERDDIIVISDEAHRTQSGRLARNMRLALPNAAFIGFTGTPLFKQDEITRRIFGDYVSRYNFKRSEEDGATVKLVYENRGEKLGVARLDLNERIAAKIEEAELDPDQAALLNCFSARTTR
jgi:type I restriction enzyme R subunit